MEWYLKVLRHYAQFSGRARRTEYWMFVLFNALVIIAGEILVGVTAILLPNNAGRSVITSVLGILLLLYMLATIVPTLAVSIRRLHDTGRSGWWMLIGLIPLAGSVVLLVFCCQVGAQGGNQYGPDPKTWPGGSPDALQNPDYASRTPGYPADPGYPSAPNYPNLGQ